MYETTVSVSLKVSVKVESEIHPQDLTVKEMRFLAANAVAELSEADIDKGITSVSVGRTTAKKKEPVEKKVSRIASLSP